MIILALSVAYLLLVWFKTNAFSEYMLLFLSFLERVFPNRFLNFIDIFKIKKWRDSQKESLAVYDYLDYIKKSYSNRMLVKILTCPICLSFWISLFLCLAVNVKWTLGIAFIGCFAFSWAAGLFDRSH